MIKQIFSGKVLLAAGIIAALLLCASLAFFYFQPPAAPPTGPGPLPAALTILPAPTATPRTLPATLTRLPPTRTMPPTPAEGEIGVGVYVQPVTGGDGLRVHVAPGLTTDLAFPDAAFDSEVFLVTDGPQQADGHTWWHLTATYDTARSGWAAEEYLTAVPSP